MKKEIIDKLTYSANIMAWTFGQGRGHFEGFNPDGNSLVAKQIGANAVKFVHKGDEAGAYIMFKDIRPLEVSETVYDDPQIINSEIKDAYSSVVVNESHDVDLDRTYSLTEGEESSTQDSLGVSVTAGIAQSISYGGEIYGAAGETSFSLDIQTSFEHGWTEGKSESRTIETSIRVPPRTKTTLTATKSRSKLRQKIHFTCDIDYSIEFMSWGQAKFYIDRREDIAEAFDGQYYDGLWTADEGDWGAQNVANAVAHSLKSQPEGYKGSFLPEINTKLTKEIKFDKSVTGQVILKDEAL